MSEHAERMSLRPGDGESAEDVIERVAREAARRNALEQLADSLFTAGVVDTRWIAPDWEYVEVVIGGERYELTLEVAS